MCKKKIILVVLAIFFLAILFNLPSYAGTQSWNSLDFNCKVNADGSMDVVETWDTYISETNTLFKDFELDESKYGGISNVSVSIVDNNNEIPLKNINEEQYHVDEGCFYALPINQNVFEIAWNVGLDDTSDNRTYIISYKVIDAVKKHNDCSEIYWQFLSKENGMSGDNITGSISIPTPVENKENFKVWMHGSLDGSYELSNNNTANFRLDSLSSNTLLETRVVVTEDVFPEVTNLTNENSLDEILEEEEKFAKDANNQRMKDFMIMCFITLIYLAIVIILARNIFKYLKEGKELSNQAVRNLNEPEYFRDIPNEKNVTPIRASYLGYFNKKSNESSYESSFSKIFAGTILDLILKGVIKYESIDPKKPKSALITFVENEIAGEKVENLSKDEKLAYDLLKKVQDKVKELTIENFESWSKKNYETFHSFQNNFLKCAKEYVEENGKIDSKAKKRVDSLKESATIYIVFLACSLSCIAFPPFIVIIIELFLCSIINRKNAKKVKILTEEGEEEANQWKALVKYMKDFSMLKDREVPELVLWEKYLVYATTFGISKKVIEQLKIVYPEINELNADTTDYRYLYLFSSSNSGYNFMDSFENNFNSVCITASQAYSRVHNMSDSGGSGGGFSSGGGGGGGGGSCGGR